jgi:hypothetical protein
MKQEATTESNRVSATSVAPRVGYVEPSIRRLAMKRPTASPPRAGTIALTPTRPRYAPKIERQRTRWSRYDAARMFRQARLTQQSLRN